MGKSKPKLNVFLKVPMISVGENKLSTCSSFPLNSQWEMFTFDWIKPRIGLAWMHSAGNSFEYGL